MPAFESVDREVVLAIHEEQLAAHGGGAGIRDIGLLDAALARLQNKTAYDETADCATFAAAHAFAIARNRPFIDGNKRTAYVVMELCLAMNGSALVASDADAVMTTLRLASGEIGEEPFAAWVRAAIKPRSA